MGAKKSTQKSSKKYEQPTSKQEQSTSKQEQSTQTEEQSTYKKQIQSTQTEEQSTYQKQKQPAQQQELPYYKQEQPDQKQELKWRCKQHPNIACELICLDGNSKDRVMCFRCVQKQQIPSSNLVSMNYILAANERDILDAYPPLKDEELSDWLKDTNLQQHLEIEVYFQKLREDIEKEVQAAEQRAKQSLIKQESQHQGLLEGYNRMAEVQKLKSLIVSEKKSAEKDLDDFIKEKWSKAEENKEEIRNLINQYQVEQYLSFDEPNKITQQIILSLQAINFLQKSKKSGSQITLIKSTFGTSQQMEITKVNNSIYQVKQLAYSGYFDQVFVDPIIDPLKKYILQIELEQKQGNSGHNFFFGLVTDQGKDSNNAYYQQMSYYDASNSYGITEYIKGSQMQSGTKVMGKHSFEVRICLNQKFLRVASLPDYSSIAELDNPNKIDTKVAYRFYLSLYSQGDMMRIMKINTVREFDDKM